MANPTNPPSNPISSRHNPRYRLWLESAQQADGYRRTGLIWAEGVRLLQSLHQAGLAPQELVLSQREYAHAQTSPEHPLHLWLAPRSSRLADAHQHDASLLEVRQAPHPAAAATTTATPQLYVVDDKLARELFTLEHAPQLAALLPPRPAPDLALAPHQRNSTQRTRPYVLLDGVQDPGNTGTLLRTAAAAGCAAAFLRSGCAAAWSPKVLRAAMGAHWRLPIVEQLSLAQCLDLSQRTGAALLATQPRAPHTLYDTKLAQPFILVLGAEGAGVSEALLQAAHTSISIPQSDAVESLNVAASAAVVLFEALRQRGEA